TRSSSCRSLISRSGSSTPWLRANSMKYSISGSVSPLMFFQVSLSNLPRITAAPPRRFAGTHGSEAGERHLSRAPLFPSLRVDPKRGNRLRLSAQGATLVARVTTEERRQWHAGSTFFLL